MSHTWIAVIIAGLALIQGFVIFLRGEQVRRLGASTEWRARLEKRIEVLESELKILQLRLQPLFTVMDQRLAMMFHQPHPHARELDALLERFDADASALKWSITEDELDRLSTLVDREYHIRSLQPGGIDPAVDIWMKLSSESLKGIRNARRALREREQAETHNRERLVGYLWRAQDQATGESPWWTQWWTRLWNGLIKFLRGFRSS